MDKIQLIHTLPDVFVNRNDVVSDVWNQEVTFEKGKIYLVEANSGTGKSSLCSFIYGYRHDYQGQILFDGEDVSRYTVKQWTTVRKKHLALLWQELRMFPELTAMENVDIKNKLTGFQKKKKIKEWFEMLGITEKMNTKMGLMSFGQQQRVALIRSLCQPFDFLFVDEPISHLDDTNADIMGRIMTEEAARQGAGIIATSIGKHIELDYHAVLNL
ncbi:MAG: ATP-binding cassette domain-containing protein [Bacteroidaceae bacterium]|nr:ATP-binding cassette domain-containing protein [Bacteroidaceae bacterium]MBR1520846.1 ATP-binding cassette domain-containing protein [Bacteroidaceae bacterium]